MAILTCPDRNQLVQFALGKCAPAITDRLANHVEGCPQCLGVLEALSADDTLVSAIREQGTLPEGREPGVVKELKAKVRSLLSSADSAVVSAGAPVQTGVGQDTCAVEAAPAGAAAEDDDGFAPPQQADEIGRLAGYRILKLLGEGGMGKVLLAEDLQLKRKVALKVMKRGLALNPKARQRFLQEAQLAAAIDHDHIAHIYQVGEDRGIPFLAMQLLNGSSLEDLLKRQGAFKIKQILRISMQVAEGLSAAHERNLIHRDIKPANIWIEPTGGGRVKILDFGLARSTAEDVGLTQTGAIMGTPAYMPPEQARGEKVDQRCDLYSLGCVMYRMATGDLPIKGNDTMAMLMALALHEPTPPVKLRDEIPAPLSDLIMKLLAKDRDKRPNSAKEVIAALKAIERSLNAPSGDTSVLPPSAMKMPADSTPAMITGQPVAKKEPTSAKEAKPENARVDSEATQSKAPAKTPQPAPANKKAMRPLVPLIGVGVAAALLLITVLVAGVVFYVQTNYGAIRIEVDDPKISFKVDDKGDFILVDADNKEVRFASGEHAIKFKNGEMEFETDKFQLRRNDKVVVRVEFLKGKLQVAQNDKIVSEKKIGTDPTSHAPPANAWKPTPEQQAFLDAVATLPADKQADAVVRKMAEVRTGNGRSAQVTFEPQDKLPTSFGYADLFEMPAWPITALPSLRSLDLSGAVVRDFTPLARLPLTDVKIFLILDDLASENALKSIRSLKTINGRPASEFWAAREKVRANIAKMAKQAASLLSVEDRNAWLMENFKLLDPNFNMKDYHACIYDGKSFHFGPAAKSRVDMTPLRSLPVEHVELMGEICVDLRPLAGSGIKSLTCSWARGLSDLSPLAGLPLTRINLHGTMVSDLRPLAGMKLESFSCAMANDNGGGPYKLADLSPLKGMPLKEVNIWGAQVADLRPLKEAKLTKLDCSYTLVTDLSPIKDMPLEELTVNFGGHDTLIVSDLTPLAKLKLKSLKCYVRPYFEPDLKLLESVAGPDFVKPAAERRKADDEWLANNAAALKGKNKDEITAIFRTGGLCAFSPVTHVVHDKGEVVEITFADLQAENMAPLRAFPKLRKLSVENRHFRERNVDLSPLLSLPLEELNIGEAVTFNLPVLRLMPKLKTINGKPAAEVLAK